MVAMATSLRCKVSAVLQILWPVFIGYVQLSKSSLSWCSLSTELYMALHMLLICQREILDHSLLSTTACMTDYVTWSCRTNCLLDLFVV